MKKSNSLVYLLAAFAPLFANAQWSAVRFDSSNVYQNIHAVTPDDAFVLGHEPTAFAGFLLRTNNGGASWDSIPFNTATDTFQLSELFFADVNNGFVGGMKNNVYQVLLKTTNGGNAWNDITPEPTSIEPIAAVFFVNATTGFAAAGATWYSTIDGGMNWSVSGIDFKPADIRFSDALNGFAAGTLADSNVAVLMKTTNGGASWTEVLSATDPNVFVNTFENLTVIDASTAFVQQLWSNVLYRTQDGGASWQTIVCDTVWQIIDFHFNDATHGHLLSGNGELYSTNDGGVTWTLNYSAEWGVYGPSVYFYSLSFADGVGYVCGSSGLIKRFEPTETNNIVSHQAVENNLRVFPNPLRSMTSLNIETKNLSGDCTIAVINHLGQKVFEEQVDISHQAVLNIDRMNLPAGRYNVVLSDASRRSTAGFVIAE